MRQTFYSVTFVSNETRNHESLRSFATLRAARIAAKRAERYGTDVRIYKGRPGEQRIS